MVIVQMILIFFTILFSWYTWYQNVFMCGILVKKDAYYETMPALPLIAAIFWALLIGTFLV